MTKILQNLNIFDRLLLVGEMFPETIDESEFKSDCMPGRIGH